MNNSKVIEAYLDELIPNPVCELDFHKDYELLIAVMLSAQTTDKRVNKVTKVLFNKYSNLKELKSADLIDIENIIKELGSYHKKAQAIIDIAKILDEKYEGIVPDNREKLESLPMVGRKTTNVVLAILYKIPNIAVDTHVFRVSKRLGLARPEDNVLDVEKKLKNSFDKNNWIKLHSQLVLFGRYYCLAKKPKCNTCKLKNICQEKSKS